MSAPIEICSKRNAVAVLASGVVISLTALTGGLAPALADPDTDPVTPTTTQRAPQPEVVTPDETDETTVVEEPSTAPTATAPATVPPSVQSPRPTQRQPAPTVEAPRPTQTSAPAPTIESSTQAEAPDPSSTAPVAPSLVPTPSTTAVSPSVTSTAPSSASSTPTTTSAPVAPGNLPTTSVSSLPPSAGLAPTSETTEAPDASGRQGTSTSSTSSTQAEAAQEIEPAEPETLEAPEQDIQLAKSAKPIEVQPVPAAKQDVAALSNEINLNVGGSDGLAASANADARLVGDRRVDRTVRQWRSDWVEYDEFYRPVIANPFRGPVRIVYVYESLPRIVFIPPLARIVLQVAQFAAYSFTAVVVNAINTTVNLAANLVETAVNVAVGTFFGGGFIPAIGVPFIAPPPLLRYDNVPVLVRYSDRQYEPFRVRRIVDVGDDARFGERQVLLDGATPVWGVWTRTATGERQFEVHRTQQFPGLDTPREAPLPGNYQLRLASNDSPSGVDAKDVYLIAAAGLLATMGLGAILLPMILGRRRPQH